MKSVLGIQKLMMRNNYLIAVRDNFEHVIGKSVLKIIEKKIENEPIHLQIKKRLFSVIVECVQNICNIDLGKERNKDSILLLSKEENGYQIVAGSNTDKTKKDRMEAILEKLSKMSIDDIKALWRDVLKDTEMLNNERQEKLTFIELFLRSEGNIRFYFEGDQNDSCYFIVQVEILKD